MNGKLNIVKLLILVAYLFVMGALFLILPWSNLWPDTIATDGWLGAIFSSPPVKGAVSGFGLVLVFGAILEIHHAISKKD